MQYDGAALGVIALGRASLDADIDNDAYTVTATMNSGGLLSWFEPTAIEASASGALTNSGAQWQRYDLDHHYAHKHRIVAMQVAPDGAVSSQITPTYRLWGEPRTSDDQMRHSRDPLSSLMAMGVDVGRTHTCTGSYPTFDGRFHYLLQLGQGQLQYFAGGSFTGWTLRCTISYIPVAGFELSDRGRTHIPHGQVWFALLTNTDFAPPVRASAPLVVGGATIRLTHYQRLSVSVADAQH